MGSSSSKSVVTVTHSVDELRAMLKKRKPSRKERTINLTASNLSIVKRLNLNLADVRGSVSALSEGRKRSTVGTYISAIINYLDALETEGLLQSTLRDKLLDQWRLELSAAAEDTAAEKATNPLTATQSKSWMTWEELCAKRDALKPEFDRIQNAAGPDEQDAVQKYLVACLYTMLPPMRNDYGEVMVTNRQYHNPIKHNWVWLSDGSNMGKFIFNHYKTSGTHGAHTLYIQEPLATIIEESFKKFPRSWLLVPSGAPLLALGDRGTARLIHRAFDNCYIGPSIIRKIAITTWSERGIGGLNRLAKAMCHSLEVSQNVYNQNTDYANNSMGIDLL